MVPDSSRVAKRGSFSLCLSLQKGGRCRRKSILCPNKTLFLLQNNLFSRRENKFSHRKNIFSRREKLFSRRENNLFTSFLYLCTIEKRINHQGKAILLSK